MDFEIIELSPAEFEKRGNIRNMKQQEKSAEQFYSELISAVSVRVKGPPIVRTIGP